MKFKQSLLAVSAALAWGTGSAAITPDEAKALGSTLTPVGATMAGNKDGSIPAYAGGLTSPPTGFKKGDGLRPDPFAGEKPKFSITSANAAQYGDKLTEGAKELLKRNGGSYRIDVYPTHRTVSFPKAVLENTLKNATHAKTSGEGRILEGAVGGYPFPIPKTGYEVMWNHLTRYVGVAYRLNYKSWNVDSTGTPTLATSGVLTEDYPYYGPNGEGGIFWRIRSDYTGPARRVGESLMVHDNINPMEKGRRAWQYLPGQRRVKLAPDIAYDAPNPGTAGATTYDDTFIFNGAMDRFDFKLVGQKEMIVPYNNYRLVFQSKSDQVLKPKHINPDTERWELHRVWVVEAKLKPSARHVYAKRVFYIDEDSWIALASDEYDARGQIYRALFNYMVPIYDVSAQFADTFVSYDFIAGMYSLSVHPAEVGGVKYSNALFAEKEWTPDSLAGSGIR